MPLIILLLASLALFAPAAAQRQALGTFSQWGAFREPSQCFAMVRAAGPVRPGQLPPAASVSFRPGRNVGFEVGFRLSRPKRAGSAILLRIDGRPFRLVGAGANAWAPGRAADAEIVAAMRRGVRMYVETRASGGGIIRDSYPLRGAATAIDAAAIGCAPPRARPQSEA